MEISPIILRLAVLLTPGLIAALLIDSLTIHKPWGQFRFLLHTFILGVVSYLFLYIVSVALNYLCLSSAIFNGLDAFFNEGVGIGWKDVLAGSLAAIVIGLILSTAIQKKWLFRIARLLNVSDKYGEESLFYFALGSPESSWARVRLIDEGLLYEGYAQSFSEDDGNVEILLSQVKVYTHPSAAYQFDLPTAYISMAKSKVIIEFPVWERSDK